jgi:hypothetical protein
LRKVSEWACSIVELMHARRLTTVKPSLFHPISES